jgi:hypothetical protein
LIQQRRICISRRYYTLIPKKQQKGRGVIRRHTGFAVSGYNIAKTPSAESFNVLNADAELTDEKTVLYVSRALKRVLLKKRIGET